jgi:hypothetical protein
MTVAAGEQQMSQRHALPRWPQARAAQELGDISLRGLGRQFVRALRRPIHLR